MFAPMLSAALTICEPTVSLAKRSQPSTISHIRSARSSESVYTCSFSKFGFDGGSDFTGSIYACCLDHTQLTTNHEQQTTNNYLVVISRTCSRMSDSSKIFCQPSRNSTGLARWLIL